MSSKIQLVAIYWRKIEKILQIERVTIRDLEVFGIKVYPVKDTCINEVRKDHRNWMLFGEVDFQGISIMIIGQAVVDVIREIDDSCHWVAAISFDFSGQLRAFSIFVFLENWTENEGFVLEEVDWSLFHQFL